MKKYSAFFLPLFIITLCGCNSGLPTTSINSNNGEDDVNYISFLGDSISTYDGYSNNTDYNDTISKNAIWYPNTNYKGADLDVEDTWWYQVSKEIDYEICVNNSWSGSVINSPDTYNVRAKNLHNNDDKTPDIIVVLMGVNDYAAGTIVGTFDQNQEVKENPTSFSEAYAKTVINMKESYPESEIFCCSFLPDRKRFSSNKNSKGYIEDEYNQAIKSICNALDINYIDLFLRSGINSQNITTYTVDKLHPNASGMDLISETIVSEIRKVLF